MRYHALACDYDGTIALDGRVSKECFAALERLKASGRRLILVTGRELDELKTVFPGVSLFDRVVAENGALLYRPQTREEKLLAESPPPEFAEQLRRRGVGPLSVGRVIVATWEPHEAAVVEAIRELGLELQVIFNKGAVMILPSGVNKATGLGHALAELGLSPHNVVGVGDAENDHALLALCECSAAVANALPTLKKRADVVMEGSHGAGVAQLIDRMLADDLRSLAPRLDRHWIPIGRRDDGREERVAPYGVNALLAGPPESGKTTLAASFLERLAEAGYQFCIVDPEGEYEGLAGAVALGDARRPPVAAEVLELLEKPGRSAAVNLLGVPLEDRPRFLQGLLPHLVELRARTGRPHWILLEEAHHLLPAAWEAAPLALPRDLHGVLMVAARPDHVAPAALNAADFVVALGGAPEETLRAFCRSIGIESPSAPAGPLEKGGALGWWRRAGGGPFRFQGAPSRAERSRHLRKYAQGDLGEDKSFYFRGPRGALNLRAQNLQLFLQLAAGVDDETWLYHLRRGDYSRWFRDAIKDPVLAERAAAAEREASAGESRARIKSAVESRYTASA